MTDHTTPQAYICGPYRGNPAQVHRNVTRALAVGAWAAAEGFFPIVPHTMGPHRGMTWEEAMERCRYLLTTLDPARDVLVTVPGWENSRGSREEVGLASVRGIPIIHLDRVVS